MSNNDRDGSFFAKLHKWLGIKLGKMTGGGVIP